MLFDNTLASLKVLNEQELNHDKDTQTMHAFNNYLKSLGVEVVMLPLRDGLTIIRKAG